MEENRLIKRKNKKSIVVLGNCQASPLEQALSLNDSFLDSFSLIKDISSIFEMPCELQSMFLENISEFDLILTQHIRNSEWQLNTDSVRKKAKQLLVYPTCFFKGYHPDATYLKLDGETVRRSPVVDYHSGIVVYSFINGLSIKESADLLVSGEWINDKYTEYLEGLFEELYLREKDYDIGIVDFLHENFRKERLFYTFNHPAPVMLFHIADEIYRILGIPGFKNKKDIRMLDSIKWLISETVKNRLGLAVNPQQEFFLEGKNYTPQKYVALHYKFYEKHPEVVRENGSMIKGMIENPV